MANDVHPYLQLLENNRRRGGNFQYTVPSPDTYPYQRLWDSCFHAIILTHFNTADAKAEILSLLSKQFENGLIPHMIYWDKVSRNDFPVIKWDKEDTSTITQPPMLSFAVWTIYQKDADIAFLKKVYPNLYHFYRYLLTERDPHENHLIGILNPDESGEDNSPRFDSVLNLPPKHTLKENHEKRLQLVAQNIKCNFDAPFCMRNFFWVKDVPFNAIMVENLQLLSAMAKEIGLEDDSVYFNKEAENISASMRNLMTEDGLFWPIWGKEYNKIKVKTWAIFAPLFGKILKKDEAKNLVEKHLLNPGEFWTKYPVPTVSVDELGFSHRNLWRGPTWIATNWFIYKGLLNYGYLEIAKQIKQSSTELIEKAGFREYFDPNTGEGYGAKNFTWGGLILDMDATFY